ncbi:hypothetical protein CCUS01_07741 [Colletotrichum cuscutae]|uniref:Uncharacterized protein n=1 Tax=Colletotrichum cuscutae TaxID=1209917 RepID=A0AAI9XZ12_9PEZI|nr:hypothetical protein CCUS01_07741 [Colletotrichum cuscutae]
MRPRDILTREAASCHYFTANRGLAVAGTVSGLQVGCNKSREAEEEIWLTSSWFTRDLHDASQYCAGINKRRCGGRQAASRKRDDGRRSYDTITASDGGKLRASCWKGLELGRIQEETKSSGLLASTYLRAPMSSVLSCPNGLLQKLALAGIPGCAFPDVFESFLLERRKAPDLPGSKLPAGGAAFEIEKRPKKKKILSRPGLMGLPASRSRPPIRNLGSSPLASFHPGDLFLITHVSLLCYLAYVADRGNLRRVRDGFLASHCKLWRAELSTVEYSVHKSYLPYSTGDGDGGTYLSFICLFPLCSSMIKKRKQDNKQPSHVSESGPCTLSSANLSKYSAASHQLTQSAEDPFQAGFFLSPMIYSVSSSECENSPSSLAPSNAVARFSLAAISFLLPTPFFGFETENIELSWCFRREPREDIEGATGRGQAGFRLIISFEAHNQRRGCKCNGAINRALLQCTPVLRYYLHTQYNKRNMLRACFVGLVFLTFLQKLKLGTWKEQDEMDLLTYLTDTSYRYFWSQKSRGWPVGRVVRAWLIYAHVIRRRLALVLRLLPSGLI